MASSTLSIDTHSSDSDKGKSRARSSVDFTISPPPSPPPIHSLYTESSYDRPHYYQSQRYGYPSSSYGTAGPSSLPRPPPLLRPRPEDLPPPPSDDDDKKNRTLRARLSGYARTILVYGLKQLLKKNNLIMLINVLHQAWRARFFVAASLRNARQFLATYPFRDEYEYWRDTAVQLVKVAFLMIKKEQRDMLIQIARQKGAKQNVQVALSLLAILQAQIAILAVQLVRASRFTLRQGVRAFNHFSAWDSIAFAISSIALTRSLQNPIHWM
ncbi:hypothetical protein BC940DRAFT_318058 [Gongronella butleri]|nr:hypothetical protein BC940DRAFT_318058 [Gongronella butleri]